MLFPTTRDMATTHPMESSRERGGGPTARAFAADTLRWVAGGELRWCACPECWSQLPFWRYVELVLRRFRIARPGGARADLARWIWAALSASPVRLALWRLADPALARAVRAIRAEADRERWHIAEVYEIVMRGVAQNAIES